MFGKNKKSEAPKGNLEKLLHYYANLNIGIETHPGMGSTVLIIMRKYDAYGNLVKRASVTLLKCQLEDLARLETSLESLATILEKAQ